MCILKFLPPIPAPRPGSGARLPAVLAGVLLFAAGAQFLLQDNGKDKPGAGQALLAPRHIRAIVVPKVPAYGAIEATPIFAASRDNSAWAGAPATSSTAATESIEALKLAGIMATAQTVTAFMKASDGSDQPVHVGSILKGWRVVMIGRDHVRLVQGSQIIDVPVGQKPHIPVIQAPSSSAVARAASGDNADTQEENQ